MRGASSVSGQSHHVVTRAIKKNSLYAVNGNTLHFLLDRATFVFVFGFTLMRAFVRMLLFRRGTASGAIIIPRWISGNSLEYRAGVSVHRRNMSRRSFNVAVAPRISVERGRRRFEMKLLVGEMQGCIVLVRQPLPRERERDWERGEGENLSRAHEHRPNEVF